MTVGVYINICQGTDVHGNTCQSEDKIKSEINSGVYGFRIVDAYFDVEDYSTPIKEYLDNFIWDYTVYDIRKDATIQISKNTVQLQDSIFSYSPDAVEKTFISYGKFNREFSQRRDKDDFILSFVLFQDTKATTYSRQVYSLLS